ncbi:MAG: protein kinase [Calothrix sp. FI2-JRJ7]|jgi:serine/threonine protein kinase|nr:protein kinase [Calothrix sp. FI2-JRJ7]
MLPGQILRNRYKIIKPLGSGGFGVTYLAEDLDLPDHPLCVVKNLRQSQSQEELQAYINFFNKEAKALYRLGKEHSQIPQLFAHFQEGGQFYLVQEYIDGHDLSQEIFYGNKLSEAKVTQLLKEILEILTIIHNQNIIHRDIKAQNLMRRNSDGKIVLIDFGTVKEISKLVGNPQELTNVSVVVGTSGYMPMEQLNGFPKLASDVYAVGMLGIYALTGIRPQELPKDPNTFEVIWQDKASVSPFLANVLDKMVRSNFRERYQTAGEALEALTTPSSKFTWRLTPPSSSPIFSPRPHFFVTKQKLLIGAGVVVSLLFGMGLLSMNSRQSTTDVGSTPDSSGLPAPEEQATLPEQPTFTATAQPEITAPTEQPTPNADICPETSVPITPNTPFIQVGKNYKYYGDLKNGQFDGCGTYIFANGKKYEGKFKEGKFHGQGTYVFANGDRYIGQFNNNFYEGTGQLIYTTGCQYIGEFKHNKFDGQGTCISPDGSRDSGIWRQGRLEGKKTCCSNP